MTIREELLRLITLNHSEQWVPNHIAFEQLQHFGGGLVPGLIECLKDEESEVRLLAVELLNESDSEAPIQALIQRLSDPDLVIRVAAARSLAKFGTNAVAALPILEPWLRNDHEYVLIVAAVTILRLAPNRRPSLLSLIETALRSDHPMVQCVAESYFTGQ